MAKSEFATGRVSGRARTITTEQLAVRLAFARATCATRMTPRGADSPAQRSPVQPKPHSSNSEIRRLESNLTPCRISARTHSNSEKMALFCFPHFARNFRADFQAFRPPLAPFTRPGFANAAAPIANIAGKQTTT